MKTNAEHASERNIFKFIMFISQRNRVSRTFQINTREVIFSENRSRREYRLISKLNFANL